jgi:ribonuclease E
MAKRMLIDSTHAEETRVVVMNGTRLEEFDVETSTKKQLKGNIYLAKIVRVEPSLQAAFVDYGGNRHGFLAFSEIHPDYYQIPVADRKALIAEQREVMKQSATANSADFGDGDSDADDIVVHDVPAENGDNGHSHDGENHAADGSDVVAVETVAGDEPEVIAPPRRKSLRNYKIQEVLKRRQIVLVQVVKEERGNKGAALTTYLSLAGRYCVLMPNTARGGGVSRKITNAVDRKRLKSIANEMDIPDGMAVIVRTAGSERTKPEIRRDYEYLLRLWDSVRELTLKSTAPALVYEEANLIKRSIRDLYSRDIDEILVDGEEGYRLAKDFMRMLTPSHARRVQLFKEPAMPLFQKFQVEAQLDAMHSAVVQLKSGGYLVINQTEALVAIDVNSGRSTKERHIEETAVKTNCEAADEVARQLRLRDLAGLIVIDFIDMEEPRNNHTVERRLKEAMRFDRARIQLGKISSFGLMELSRQRLRPSLMETSFQTCTHCGGTGLVRSVESASVHVLRAISEEGIRRRSIEVTVTVHPSVALYILNQKRGALSDIEVRYGFRVYLLGDDSLNPPLFRMDRVKSDLPIDAPAFKPINSDQRIPDEIEDEDEEIIEDEEVEEIAEAVEVRPAEITAAVVIPVVVAQDKNGDDEGVRRRRRRRRRRGRREDGSPMTAAEVEAEDAAEAAAEAAGEPIETDIEGAEDGEEGEDATGTIEVAEGDPAPRRRRRGKRGGRRRNRGRDGQVLVEGDEGYEPEPADGLDAAEDGDDAEPAEAVSDENGAVSDASPVETGEQASVEAAADAVAEEAPAKPKRSRARKKPAAAEGETETAATSEDAVPAKPKRVRAPRKKAEPVETAVETVSEPTVETPVESIPAPVDAIEAPVQVVPAPVETVIAPQPVEEVAPQPPSEPETNAEEPTEDSGPARKGWWNRFL